MPSICYNLSMLETFLWFLAGHFIGDFPFQSEWMVIEKGKSWEINGYHAAVYTASMFLVAQIGGIALSPLALLLFFVSHFLIDPLKARWKIIKSIWIDQLLHFLVILLVLFYFI